MDKISTILPNNNRLSSTPTEWSTDSGRISARGAQDSVHGRHVLKSSREGALQAHRELRGWRANQARHSEIAENVQKGFFSKPEITPIHSEIPQAYTEDFLMAPSSAPTQESSFDQELEDYISGVMAEAESFRAGAQETSAAEEDLSMYPKGSFLDLEV